MSTIYNPTNLLVNTSSLIGQLSLSRTESALSVSIRNLSTGLRIHSGRDDPAGFIASNSMRTDITSTAQAVANCQRADAVISTTDSALGELNNLLNDLRGLATEAANTGAENDSTLKSLQMQADSVLDAIDRISNQTQFQQQKLIDGSLDFTTYGLDSSKISYYQINQANFLGRTEKDISVKVLEPPKQGELYYPLGALSNNVVLDVGGTKGYQSYSFDKDATVQQIADAVNRNSDATGVEATVYSKSTAGNISLTSYGKNNDILLTASQSGTAAGNFVVRYTAPKEGNAEAYLNVFPGSGNEPTEIEVVLQTELWQNAEYHYNGNQDGIPNNEFSIRANYAGTEFNDVEFEFVNVFETDREPGVDADLTSVPKRITINVSYDETDPTAATNSTVDDLKEWFAADPTLNTYFTLSDTSPSDGSGPLIPTTPFTTMQQGVDGGAVRTTAEQVATLINTSSELRYPDGTGMVTATIPNGTTGTGTVSPFDEYSYYGDPQQKNYLQFLGPAGSPTIKFVSTPGTPLSVDDTTFPPVDGNATALVQGFEAGTSFSVKALNIGPEYDDIGIVFQDSTQESVVYDKSRGALVVSVDFTGRQTSSPPNDFTMNDLRQMFADDPLVSSQFAVIPATAYDSANPPKFSSPNYQGINAQLGQTSGGRVSDGTVLVHLETDANGVIKTTANDLVKFFNDPSTEESKAVLDRLGISVSLIDPTSSTTPVCTLGTAENGIGVLKPTYDPNDPACVDHTGLYPDIIFTSSGSDIREDYPTATVSSSNGLDSSFTVTAKQIGSGFNNTTIRVVSDTQGPSVKFNRTTMELVVGVSPTSAITANDVIALINSDSATKDLFIASNAPFSTGTGSVAVGDHATLTGGIKAVDGRADAMVVSSNGMNAMFEVRAKQTGDQYDDTQILIVSDADGPRVSYDSQSKQLTIGINSLYPPSAQDVVNLINATEGVKEKFEAAIPTVVPGTMIVPTGEAAVRVGDSGTLHVSMNGSSRGAPMLGNSDKMNLGITFHSTDYGSGAFVSVAASLGTEFPLTDRFGNVATRSTGTDVVALINGEYAIGNGQVASSKTSDLDLDLWIDPSAQKGEVFGFRISGGGALMQLGPDAVYWQQSRVGIKNMNSVSLGGVSGHLSQIRTGGPYDLLTDTKTAFKIIEEVTEEVSSLRGRLGAFQRNQIQANMENMVDTIDIETTAWSEIKDTDFAAASSELMRQQLLMESTVTVLKYPSQNARMLLGLIQN